MNKKNKMSSKNNVPDSSNPSFQQVATNHSSEQSATTNPQPDLAAKIIDLTNDLKRTRADFENYRKQMDIQKAQTAEFAKSETVKKFLPLLDDMDRAIAATPELAPLAKSLEKTVKELGLEKIDSHEGVDFNPDLHDAVMMEEGTGEKEVVKETLRPGYFYGGKVIRPAMVKVTTA